jgi:hypothetical protein
MRHFFALSLLAIGFTGCGGGAAPGGASGQLATEAQTMVVQYDLDDDGEPDWVTLDTSTSPFQVVEAVHGTTDGEPVDITDLLAGTPIEPELSQALADHLARSFDVDQRTELEVLLSGDRRVSVTVLD